MDNLSCLKFLFCSLLFKNIQCGRKIISAALYSFVVEVSVSKNVWWTQPSYIVTSMHHLMYLYGFPKSLYAFQNYDNLCYVISHYLLPKSLETAIINL